MTLVKYSSLYQIVLLHTISMYIESLDTSILFCNPSNLTIKRVHHEKKRPSCLSISYGIQNQLFVTIIFQPEEYILDILLPLTTYGNLYVIWSPTLYTRSVKANGSNSTLIWLELIPKPFASQLTIFRLISSETNCKKLNLKGGFNILCVTWESYPGSVKCFSTSNPLHVFIPYLFRDMQNLFHGG